MSFDKPTRNQLSRMVSAARDTLRSDITAQLQTNFRLQPDGTALSLDGLTDDLRTAAEELRQLLDHFAASIPATDKKIDVRAQAHDRLVREIGFTILNRLAALRLCEERGLVIECVRQGMASAGFQMFDKLANGALGPRYETYRAFLENLFDELAIDLGVLFDRHSPLSHVFPGERALEEVLDLLNDPALTHLWAADETIGWIYQYYNDEAERKQMRDESQAPRNSRELAVRNQFFTPRYVVEFLTDNTLGRIWYEMRGGDTALREKCRYLVIRPDETVSGQPSVVSRQKKDPRDIKMLDPAGGSGHFGLYCFDLFETIYAEAYDDLDLGPKLQADYPDRAAYLRDVPRLILEHNLHIIDIDPRACQIAALALWLRAQRSWQAMGLKAHDRPRVTKANVVCAEPMPGERDLLDEFAADLQPPELAELVRFVFDRMQLAGEAGSLLKIEEDLRGKIEELRNKVGPLFAQGDFWDNAEIRALQALRDYTEQATNGSTARRLLFADDAAQGFAFIDLCLKKYDMALMNPPFGEAAKATRSYIEQAYPKTKNDVYAAFVERGLERLTSNGMLGAITSRTGFFLSSFQKWREEILLKNAPPVVFADLGQGVLDAAMVETAAYCLRVGDVRTSYFFRLLHEEDRAMVLTEAASMVRKGQKHDAFYPVNPASFRQIPSSPFAYWVSEGIRTIFNTLPPLEGDGRTVKQGLSTADDFRFVRTWWEVPSLSLVCGTTDDGPAQFRDSTFHHKRWAPFVKGGAYAPYYADLYAVVNWEFDGREVKAWADPLYGNSGWSRIIKSVDYYFRPGLTWPLRGIRLSAQAVPQGAIFSVAGKVAISDRIADLPELLAIINSRPFDFLVGLFAGKVGGVQYEVGLIGRIPIPLNLHAAQLKEQCMAAQRAAMAPHVFEELGHNYKMPALLSVRGNSINDLVARWQVEIEETHQRLLLHQLKIDDIVFEMYGIGAGDKQIVDELIPSSASVETEFEDGEHAVLNHYDLVIDLLTYFVGCAIGRWDIRLALDPSIAPKLPDPFDPPPACPPGMLVGPDGLPATPGRIVSEAWLRARPNAITLPRDEGRSAGMKDEVIPDSQYPVHIAWDGILVDDPGLDEKVEHLHPDDIVQRMREVLAVLWGERADAIEQEACDILGVKSLRDYFRGPSGFFADHLKRYSKSRRQAPIYWPLSTASGRYTVWVYYHRLTQDTLFGIVNGYVTPKIDEVQLEVDKLADKAKSASGKTKSDLQAKVEDLKSFLGELTDFKAELLRIAALPYKPDLNDGVIINAAPLHKLFRLRKWATDTAAVWKKLEAGEYDWAHLAYTVWPKRVEKVCETDRSIAIAHNLEQLCKIEVKKSKGKRKKKVEESEDLE